MKAAGARAERWRGFRELRHGTITRRNIGGDGLNFIATFQRDSDKRRCVPPETTGIKANLETPVPQRAGVSFMEPSLSDGVVPRDWPIFFDPAAYYATALAQLVLAVPPAARRLSCDSLCHRIPCTQSHP